MNLAVREVIVSREEILYSIVSDELLYDPMILKYRMTERRAE